jgi:hypothetical protein
VVSLALVTVSESSITTILRSALNAAIGTLTAHYPNPFFLEVTDVTLTELLEIDLRLIFPIERPAMAYAESLWKNCGSPTKPKSLSRVLERIMVTCQREGVRYPPILLLRRKELQRGLWSPEPPPRDAPPAALPGPAAGEPLLPVDCGVCANKGFVRDANGSGRLCSCWAQRTGAGPPAAPE